MTLCVGIQVCWYSDMDVDPSVFAVRCELRCWCICSQILSTLNMRVGFVGVADMDSKHGMNVLANMWGLHLAEK